MSELKYNLYSIGHSTHNRERFSALLELAGVNAIADVRSSPYSRHLPHFSQNELKPWLNQNSISYAFLGKELGGRPTNLPFMPMVLQTMRQWLQPTLLSKVWIVSSKALRATASP